MTHRNFQLPTRSVPLQDRSVTNCLSWHRFPQPSGNRLRLRRRAEFQGDFLPLDGQLPWSFNRNSDPTASNVGDLDPNAAADDDFLSNLPSQNKHGHSLFQRSIVGTDDL